MGSQPNNEELAYIAGFLDGDGSLMLQVKKRTDCKIGFRFMLTICFYQDSRHSQPLAWIRGRLGIGYLSHRNDGMTELRINGYNQVQSILEKLLPYIRFKKIQARMMIKATKILSSKKLSQLDKKDIASIAKVILVIQKENYQSGQKSKESKLYKILGLTPYRLNPKG